MTNRTPHIPDDQRAAWEKSCFKNEPGQADPAPEKRDAKAVAKPPRAPKAKK